MTDFRGGGNCQEPKKEMFGPRGGPWLAEPNASSAIIYTGVVPAGPFEQVPATTFSYTFHLLR